MRKVIIGGFAVIGGAYVIKSVGSYILKTYRKEIRAVVLDKTVTYFFEEDEEDDNSHDDPLKAAIMAYMDAKKKGAKS